MQLLKVNVIHIAAFVSNGRKAQALFTSTSVSKISYSVAYSSPLLKPLSASPTAAFIPSLSSRVLCKAHPTWAARFSDAQLDGFEAAHLALGTQSVSRLAECIAAQYEIEMCLRTVVLQGGAVRLGDKIIEQNNLDELGGNLRTIVSLSALYNDLNNVLNNRLKPERPAMSATRLCELLSVASLDNDTRELLLHRISESAIHFPSIDDSALELITTERLKVGLLDGSICGSEFVRFALAAGYSKGEIMGTLDSIADSVGDVLWSEEVMNRIDVGALQTLVDRLSGQS